MSRKLRNWTRRESDIENDDLRLVHDDGRHISRVLLVPAQPQKRRVALRTLVDDC